MIPRRERDDLERLSRDRERIAKAAVDVRAAELKADLERQLSTTYSFDQDAVWEEAHRASAEVVEQANRAIADQCNKLGIPPQFAPAMDLHWYGRGRTPAKSGERNCERPQTRRLTLKERMPR